MKKLESKLLDIIVPIFNKEIFLSELTKSLALLCQEKVNVIFVDDGSTDQSLKVLESNLSVNFFVYFKENGGVSSARNYGLRKSKSKYIWFFDPDDKLGSDVFNIIDSLNEYNEDILIFNYNIKLDKTGELRSFKFDSYGLISSEYFVEKYSYFTNKNNMSFIWNKLYKSSFIKGFYFDESVHLSEDRRFNINIFNENPVVLILNSFLYEYYIYDGGTLSTAINLKKIEDVYKTNLLNLKTLGFPIKSSIIHIRTQLISRALLGEKKLLSFYLQESFRLNLSIVNIKGFKNIFILFLIYIGIFKMVYNFYMFFRSRFN